MSQAAKRGEMMQTLAILKPDAFESQVSGRIMSHLENAGFQIRAARLVRLTEAEAKAFYEVHRQRPFYDPLVAYMTSGPCMPLVLAREDAVAHLRKVIGATDPTEAEEGTVRRLYAESKERNVIHASDSQENAASEITFFFSRAELERLWASGSR
jgi:nucleoside-diphosphate kinase